MEECLTVKELFLLLKEEIDKGNESDYVIAESSHDMIAINKVGLSKRIDYGCVSAYYLELKGVLL